MSTHPSKVELRRFRASVRPRRGTGGLENGENSPRKRGRTQAQMAEVPEISQPKVSALLRYRLEGYSVERLMRFLVALGQDVEIVVRAKPRGRAGRIAVTAA